MLNFFNKNILFLLLFLFTPFSLNAQIMNIGDDYQLIYQVIDGSGDHVTGETVTLQIKKISNGDWFDFNDSSFKSSGWTSKTVNLSEDSTNGFYYYTWTPPGTETTADLYQFLVDNGSVTYGDHQSELVSYVDLISASSVWAVGTKEITGGVIDTNNDKSGYSLTASAIDSIWDEPQSGHTTAGTFGKYLDTEVSGVGGSPPTAAAVADAVLEELISDHSGVSGSLAEKISLLDDRTDGDKESGSYTGIESLIRRSGN